MANLRIMEMTAPRTAKPEEALRKLRIRPQPETSTEGFIPRYKASFPGLIEAMGSVE